MINTWCGELHALYYKIWRISLNIYLNWGVYQGQDVSSGQVT